ncbi:hypothetical protein ACA910_001784 [Epithemia clementina (nom. ined.)]
MSGSNDDITIDCRARRCRYVESECFVEYEGLMVCTLSHWVPPKASWPSVPDFSYTSTVGWELLLHPLDVMMPSPRNNRRCRSNSSAFKQATLRAPQSYRISAYDISQVKALGNEKLSFRTATCVWEIQCHSRNSHDLLFACLSAQVKCVDDQRPAAEATEDTDESSVEDDIDSLTDRCIRVSVERESFGAKWERRWGRAFHNIQEMVTGGAV